MKRKFKPTWSNKKRTITYHLESLNISKPKYMVVDIQVLAGNTTKPYLLIPIYRS